MLTEEKKNTTFSKHSKYQVKKKFKKRVQTEAGSWHFNKSTKKNSKSSITVQKLC